VKILLIEDDPVISTALLEAFSDQHYTVNLATDGETGLNLARTYPYDAIVLDVVIPKIDGISLCKQLRAEDYQNPILLLTAKDSSCDRVTGLDAGADDYVVKPFDLPELLARVRALLRRGKPVPSSTIVWENVQFDTSECKVTCNGQSIHLTPKEYCLLELFLLNPKRIFSRSAILDRLWDFADSPGEETVSTHIKCVRQKLKAAGSSDPIETVHGLGYRLRVPAQLQQSDEPKSTHEARTTQIQARTLKIWEKHKNDLAKRLEILEGISISLTPQSHELAKLEAHRLAGTLGIFGLKEGSRLALEIEQLLQVETPPIQQISQLVQQLRQVFDKGVDTPLTATPSYSPLILIVDDDLVLAERLRIEAIAWGMRVEVATDLTIARQMIAQKPPDAIVLDLNFPSPSEDGMMLLRELSDRPAKIPAIAFTGRESLADRVAVAQLGGCAFLHKPLPTQQILKAITEALNPTRQTPGNRVLLVDDDPLFLEILSNQLCSLGVEVTTLKNPKQFWEVLTASTPNLLVLDMKMPDFNGAQLCQVVRTDPQWHRLPILFLSAHTTTEEIDRAFLSGADDYISKSSDKAEIVKRIVRRLQRTGWQRGQTKIEQEKVIADEPSTKRPTRQRKN
jgi:DNA-binding response OmpR family regulator